MSGVVSYSCQWLLAARRSRIAAYFFDKGTLEMEWKWYLGSLETLKV